MLIPERQTSGRKVGIESFRVTGNENVQARSYCPTELATDENTLLAFPPIKRIVPTTITNTTASMTAYSATSCPRSSDHNCWKNLATESSLNPGYLLLCGREQLPGGHQHKWS